MQKQALNLILITAFSIIAGSASAQDNLSAAFKKSIYNADKLFDEGRYLKARVIYDSLWNMRPNDVYLHYKVAACLVYKSDSREKAYELLKEIEGEEGYDDIIFYMARAKHYNYEFEEAIKLYNQYVDIHRPSGTRRINTLHFIGNCRNGIELMKRRLALSLEILDPPSNNINSEYSPVLSHDGQKLYYTNRGPSSKGELMDEKSKKSDFGSFYEDIFVANNEGSEDEPVFSVGKSLSDNINEADRHEAPLSISYDNQMLFVYLSGDKEAEDIYVSYNDNDTAWTKPQKIKGINTPQWEGHASLAPDGKTLYFSSDRPGGYGGRDIYTATMKEDSTFGNVQNMGSKINTPFNEDAPFIFSNSSSLYFASEAHGSMGGYDICYIKYDSATSKWQDAVNMGYPINTTDDDLYYNISEDGDWGYFNSARASGENLHDIYRIQPGTFERLNALILLVGTVYIDDVPGSALVKIMDDKTGDVLAKLIADSLSGEFVYSLLPGRQYKISLLVDDFAPKVEYVEVPPLTEGVTRIEHRFDFYSMDYLARREDSLNLQQEIDNRVKLSIADDGTCTIDQDREELTKEEIEAGCYFRVQVGAYRNPGKFKYEFLRSVGDVEIKGSPDGITRYLMGDKFTKRSEAEKLRQQCVMAGQWDAWITVRR
ncbi:MAG: hypothetical protein WEC59_02950 [Salibacteraceae bacterium]